MEGSNNVRPLMSTGIQHAMFQLAVHWITYFKINMLYLYQALAKILFCSVVAAELSVFDQ